MIFQCKQANILDQRLNIIIFAAVFTFLTAIVYLRELYDIFTYYIFWAVVFDQVSRIFKPASLKAKEVFKLHQITKKQIEAYVRSKKAYRLTTFGLAVLIGIITKISISEFSAYFFSTYFILWCLYPLYRIFYLEIPAPKIKFEARQVNCNGNFSDSFYDELNPRSSLAWNSAQANRTLEIMNSMNSASSRSRYY